MTCKIWFVEKLYCFLITLHDRKKRVYGLNLAEKNPKVCGKDTARMNYEYLSIFLIENAQN